MAASSSLLKNFRVNLTSLLSNVYSQRQLDELVLLCHSLAVTSIRGKLSAGKINTEFLGLNDSDLAYDCIADLFQRDETGRAVHIETYFESFLVEAASDELLLAHLRRLIFARVNQSLFRLYNEVDPSLGKIIRNIKLAIHSLGGFVEIERFGESFIAPSLCDPLFQLPELGDDEFQRFIRQQCVGRERIPEILAKLSSSLRQQDDCSRAVRLISVAYAIRALLGEIDAKSHEAPAVEQLLLVDDTHTVIRETCREVSEKNFSKYVGKRKVTEQHYGHYFHVIEGRLKEIFVGQDGEDYSLFDQLSLLMPLTPDEYKQRHKNILEYLSRMAYERAREKLRKG